MNVNLGRKHFGKIVMGRPTQNDQTRAARQLVEQNSDQVCDESRTVLRYPVINSSSSNSSPEPCRGEHAGAQTITDPFDRQNAAPGISE